MKRKIYLGVVIAALLPKCDQEELQIRMPQGHGRLIINLVTSSEEFELHITDLDHISIVPDALDLLPRLLFRRPQRQTEVWVIR